MEKLAVLDALGLDEAHTAVYRFVLQQPSASTAEIGSGLSISLPRTRPIVAELERLGLLARQAARSDRFVASPPSISLRPLLLERERGLTRAHEALVELSDLYRRSAEQRSVADVVDVVIGDDAVRQRVAQLQAASVEQVRVLVLHEVALLSGEENIEEDRALARGVRYRVIVENAVLERPGFLDAAREMAQIGEEIRVLPTLPTRMFIADDQMALVPMHSQAEDQGFGALLIHPSGLLDLVTSIFEEYWRAATEFLPIAAVPTADAVDTDLLRLLLLGVTDAAAAAQLGISLRTVQRRVSDLMETAGVTTRMQLGAEAVRRNWV
ncbi:MULTISPECIES: transcriptional regulator TrmB [Microbacterium]|uniref:transcriptional regulator TrmB n=1 Tax=Microbacterium TaxID=33882 RepID=UPI001FDEB061|nr:MULTISPECIES: transcriptional regulator TrmB [Microbacterium]MDR7189516.1 sugar-specific transcriptional regulator TrmB/DNA-binding CsgD family transcriptional regulator [Microbacterium sp. BE35]